MGFPAASVVRNPPANAGDLGSIPGSGRSLEKEMATCSSIITWEIRWTEGPDGLQFMGLQRVRHDSTKQQQMMINIPPHWPLIDSQMPTKRASPLEWALPRNCKLMCVPGEENKSSLITGTKGTSCQGSMNERWITEYIFRKMRQKGRLGRQKKMDTNSEPSF